MVDIMNFLDIILLGPGGVLARGGGGGVSGLERSHYGGMTARRGHIRHTFFTFLNKNLYLSGRAFSSEAESTQFDSDRCLILTYRRGLGGNQSKLDHNC